VRSYGQYCPIARAAEILGDRWTVLIIREMSFGVSRFNELQRCLPGISRSVLAQRLRHLQRVGLVELVDGEYVLTEAGRDVKSVLRSLGHWAARWAFGEPTADELDTDLLMRWISRHLAPDALPDHRVVVRFDFTGRRARRYWLVLRPTEQSVCLHEPGFDTDVVITTDAATLYSVYLGRCTLQSATRDGLVDLAGPRKLVRALPNWFAWSQFAPTVRAAMLASTG
jgi:DNA-binding HxlR family transcriptional regulator